MATFDTIQTQQQDTPADARYRRIFFAGQSGRPVSEVLALSDEDFAALDSGFNCRTGRDSVSALNRIANAINSDADLKAVWPKAGE